MVCGYTSMGLQTGKYRVDRAAACNSCIALPLIGLPPGSLVVTSGSVDHRLLVAEVLERAGLTPVHGRDGRVTCAVPPSDLPDVAADLALRLPADALDGCAALISETEPDEPALVDQPTLRALLRRVERGWLTEILGHGRLDTHLQPIVDLSTGASTPFAHECLTRGRTADGETIPAGRLFAAADRAALMFHLDRSARVTSIANAARFDRAGRYFVNFTPTSIYNPAYCLRSTVEAVDDGGIAPDQVTFEVIESVRMQDLPHLDKIFAVYRARGFTVALDDITGGPVSSRMIDQLRPDYVKLDRSLIDHVETAPDRQRSVADVLGQCRSLGIEVIAEGIERSEERDWLASVGIRLMQGYLFGRPFPA